MSDITLGLLIEPGADPKRDAIHVAVAPVTSDEKLQPGEHVALVEGTCNMVKASLSNRVGIVDPFLRRPVEPGQRFWLCLYLKTVTGLRHDWSHPAFKEDISPITYPESEQWIRNYCSDNDLEYTELMQCIDTGESYHTGEDEKDSPPTEFWTHWERVTGKKHEKYSSEFYFRCAC